MGLGNFAPKGGMCAGCVFKRMQCDHLPFHKMQVIDHCKVSNYKIVKCDKYQKSNNNPV